MVEQNEAASQTAHPECEWEEQQAVLGGGQRTMSEPEAS